MGTFGPETAGFFLVSVVCCHVQEHFVLEVLPVDFQSEVCVIAHPK